MKVKACAVILFGVFLAGCEPPLRSQDFEPKLFSWPGDSVDVAMSVDRGNLIVPLMINGKGPFRFEVDTGCGAAMVVTEGLAKELSLAAVKNVSFSYPRVDGTKEVSRQWAARIDSIRLADIDYGGMYVRVASVEEFTGLSKIDGIIGWPMLSKGFVTLDIPALKLRFQREGSLSTPALENATTSPLRVTNGVPMIFATLAAGEPKEKKVDLVLDTGSGFPLILPVACRGLFDRAGPVATGTGHSVFGDQEVKLEWHTTPIGLPGGIRKGMFVMFNDHGPVYAVGMPILRDYVITIDNAAKAMRLEYIPPSGSPAWRPVNE